MADAVMVTGNAGTVATTVAGMVSTAMMVIGIAGKTALRDPSLARKCPKRGR